MATLGDDCTDRTNGTLIVGSYTCVWEKYSFPSDALITGFCVYLKGGSATVKLKIFRLVSGTYQYVGESGSVDGSAGGLISGTCNINVQTGDILGIYLSYHWPASVWGSNTYAYMAYSGDITSNVTKTDGADYSADILSLKATYSTISNDVYVDLNKADDTGDGLSFANAKKTMSAGYVILNSTGTLHVASGDYSGQTAITYNKSWSLSPEDPNSTGSKSVSIPVSG